MATTSVSTSTVPSNASVEIKDSKKMERIHDALFKYKKPISIACFSAVVLTGVVALGLGASLYVPAMAGILPLTVLTFMGSHIIAFELGVVATIISSLLLCAAGISLQFIKDPHAIANSTSSGLAEGGKDGASDGAVHDKDSDDKPASAAGLMFRQANQIFRIDAQINAAKDAGMNYGMTDEQAQEWASKLIAHHTEQGTMPADGFTAEQLAFEAKKCVFKSFLYSEVSRLYDYASSPLRLDNDESALAWAKRCVTKHYQDQIEKNEAAKTADALEIPSEGLTNDQIVEFYAASFSLKAELKAFVEVHAMAWENRRQDINWFSPWEWGGALKTVVNREIWGEDK